MNEVYLVCAYRDDGEKSTEEWSEHSSLDAAKRLRDSIQEDIDKDKQKSTIFAFVTLYKAIEIED